MSPHAWHSTASREKGFVLYPSHTVFPTFTADQWGRWREQEKKVEGDEGGMTNGLWAASREGRRCQSHESGDAHVTPPSSSPSFSLSLSIHTTAPPPLSIRLSVSISFSVSLCQTGLSRFCPISSPPPLLSPGPRNYSLGSVIRVKWSDKSAVGCVCMRVCKFVCAKSLGIVTLTGSQAAFS